MKKSNPKPKKYLSDGTEAKVGKIVVALSRSSVGFTSSIGPVRIAKLNINQKAIDRWQTDVMCEIQSEHVRKGNPEAIRLDGAKHMSYYNRTKELREATPEERKEYYKRLHEVAV